MKPTRITRLIELLGLLQGGSGHNATTLARECGVSRRTIFRDLDVLRQAGVPLTFDDERQLYCIPRTFFLPPTNFATDEALCLLVLCSQLGDARGLPFHSPARRAATKLEGSLPSRFREELHDVLGKIEVRWSQTNPLEGKENTYETLKSAVTGHRCVRIEYDSYSENEVIRTRLSPYRLLFLRRSWYVIGRSSLHRATRTFNIGRIRELETLDDTFRVPRGFSVERYLGNAWQMIRGPGPDHEVVVQFDSKVARNVEEVAWHKTQKVTPLSGGRIEFQATVSGLPEIGWWILGYGRHAKVVRPEALRRIIRDHAAAMLEYYADLSAPGETDKAIAAPQPRRKS